MQRIIILVIIGLTVGLYAQDIVNNPKEGYLIETVMEEDNRKEIHFVSPDGKIVKVLPARKDECHISKVKGMEVRNFSEVLVSGNCRYALQIEESSPHDGVRLRNKI